MWAGIASHSVRYGALIIRGHTLTVGGQLPDAAREAQLAAAATRPSPTPASEATAVTVMAMPSQIRGPPWTQDWSERANTTVAPTK
jgi:hypothetical protein